MRAARWVPPAYLAPEQIEGGSIDGRADVYSLGCLLYECLTAEAPFSVARGWPWPGRTWRKSHHAQAIFRNELPQAIDEVIRKAMAKEPDGSLPDLCRVDRRGRGGARASQAVGRRWTQVHVIDAVATLVVLAGVLVAALVLDERRPRASRRRHCRHARPHRSRDQQGHGGRRCRPETLCDRRRWSRRLGLQRRRPIGLGDQPRNRRPSGTRQGSSPRPVTGFLQGRCSPLTPQAPGSSASTSAGGRISRGCSRGHAGNARIG